MRVAGVDGFLGFRRFGFFPLVVLLFLQGCAPLGLSTPERQRGQGTHRLVAGSEAEVRAGVHAIFAKMGSDFAITDQGEQVQSTYRGNAFALRYKTFLTAGPDPGVTGLEMLCELPGSVKAEGIRQCENNFLDGVVEAVEHVGCGKRSEPHQLRFVRCVPYRLRTAIITGETVMSSVICAASKIIKRL